MSGERAEPFVERAPFKRYAPIALAAGLVAVFAFFNPRAPKDHEIELRLDDPALVTRVEVAWLEIGSRETMQTGAWSFEAGKAPRQITTHVRAPDGKYDVEIEIDRADGEHREHRTLELGSVEKMTLPLR